MPTRSTTPRDSLLVLSFELTVAEKVHHPFSHIPAVHDERVRCGDYDEVCCPFGPGPVNGDLAVVFADQRTFGSLAIDPLQGPRDGLAVTPAPRYGCAKKLV